MVGAQIKGCILVWMCGDHCYIKTSSSELSLPWISMTFSIQTKLSKHLFDHFFIFQRSVDNKLKKARGSVCEGVVFRPVSNVRLKS